MELFFLLNKEEKIKKIEKINKLLEKWLNNSPRQIINWKEFVRYSINLLLKNIEYNPTSLSPVPLEKIVPLLSIRLILDENFPFEGKIYEEGNIWIMKIRGKAKDIYNNSRVRFTIAHEIGHFLYNQSIKEIYPKKLPDEEQISNFIASEILFPSYFLNLSFKKISIKLYGNLQKSDLFPFLLDLAKKMKISLSSLIVKLNKSKILDDLQYGILISKFMPNKYNIIKSSVSLRTFLVSTPTWGFIPTNYKLIKLGFENSSYLFHSLIYRRPYSWMGEVEVWEKYKNGKYLKKKIKTHGEHILLNIRNNEHLLTFFKWDKPNEF